MIGKEKRENSEETIRKLNTVNTFLICQNKTKKEEKTMK